MTPNGAKDFNKRYWITCSGIRLQRGCNNQGYMVVTHSHSVRIYNAELLPLNFVRISAVAERGTAQCAKSVRILSTAAQWNKKFHLKRLAVGELPWRSLKVMGPKFKKWITYEPNHAHFGGNLSSQSNIWRQFDDSSISHSRIWFGPLKFKMGHMTVTMPLSEVVCYP